MAVKVKEKVLKSFLRKLVENQHLKQPESWDNKEPIKPLEMLSTQLAVEAPPVNDPDYLPGTHGELGRSAQVITDEVPADQIEYFYKRMLDLLATVQDSHNDKKLADELHESIKRLLESDHDRPRVRRRIRIDPEEEDEFGDADDAAAQWLRQQEEQGLQTKEKSRSVQRTSDDSEAGSLGSYVSDESEHEEEIDRALAHDDKGAVDSVDSAKILNPKLAEINKAASAAKLPDDLHSGHGLDYLVRMAKTWEFSDEVPYLDVVFLSIFGLHELSYMIMNANYMLEYGGLQLAPRDTGFGTQMTIAPIEGGRSSKAFQRGFLKDAEEKYGMNYDNMMHIRNISRMSKEELKSTITSALSGMARHNPVVNQSLNRWVNDKDSEFNSITDVVGFLSDLFVLSYEQEVRYEKREEQRPDYEYMDREPALDFIDTAINRKFSRVRKGTTKPIKPPFFYTYVSFMRSAHLYEDQILEIYPDLIMELFLKDRKYYKRKLGKIVIKHEQIEGHTKQFTPAQMLEEIKKFLNTKIQVSKDMKADRESEEVPDDDEYLDIEAERSVKDAETGETEKMIKQLEKQADPKRYTHLAPLYGFSTESGIRQWVLKFPERRLRIHALGNNDADNFPGAKEFSETSSKILEHLIINFPEYVDLIGRNTLDDLSREFITLAEKAKGVDKPTISQEDITKQSAELDELMSIVKKDLEAINEVIMDLPISDIAVIQGALENDVDIPFNRLSDGTQEDFDEEELVAMIESYTQAMSGVGGIVVRNATGDIMNQVITDTDKPWRTAIAGILERDYELIDKKLAWSLAEHFMGKKNIPNFGNASAALTKKFLKLGISEPEFYELIQQGYLELDKLLSSNLAKKTNDAKQLLNKLLSADLETVRNQSPEAQEKIIRNALEIYPRIFLTGLKEFFSLADIESDLRRAAERAAELKALLNEIKAFNGLLEVIK